MGNPMRLELTCVGLPVKFANHYTIRGAQDSRSVADIFVVGTRDHFL